jgi:hypothetical protein
LSQLDGASARLPQGKVALALAGVIRPAVLRGQEGFAFYSLNESDEVAAETEFFVRGKDAGTVASSIGARHKSLKRQEAAGKWGCGDLWSRIVRAHQLLR